MNLPFLRRLSTAGSPVINLNQVRVATPCPAKWEDMVGDDRTRHCSECNLNVYNLSAMTANEVHKLVVISQSNGSRLCARFYRRADGTMITQDCPRGLRAATRHIAKVAAAVLSTLMSVNMFAAKTNQHSCSVQSATAQKRPGIWLQIMDPQGAVLPGAQIDLVDEGLKKIFSGESSGAGEVALTNLPAGNYTLTITARGFKTFTRAVPVRDAQVLQVKIKLALAEAKTEVEVTAGAVLVQGAMVGIVTTIENSNWPSVGGRTQPAPMRQ